MYKHKVFHGASGGLIAVPALSSLQRRRGRICEAEGVRSSADVPEGLDAATERCEPVRRCYVEASFAVAPAFVNCSGRANEW